MLAHLPWDNVDNVDQNALFQLARRLPGRGQGPPVLDQLQVGTLHHHHLRQPGRAPEDDRQVCQELTSLVGVTHDSIYLWIMNGGRELCLLTIRGH